MGRLELTWREEFARGGERREPTRISWDIEVL